VELVNQNISTVTIYGTTTRVQNIPVNFTISTYPAGAEVFSLSKSSETTNNQGIADVQLKLGNIPAEYGVRAECPSCVPEFSSVTFNYCGKLKTDDFKQFDDRWATNIYDNTTNTIRAKGCVVTSLATLINYYHKEYDNLISSTTPAELNEYLINLGRRGYSSGNVKWNAVEIFSNNRIRFVDLIDISTITPIVTIGDLIEKIDNELLSKRPVVLRIKGYESPSHFILAIGKCNGNYIILDPGSAIRVLYNPNDKEHPLLGIRRFRLTQ
jgi:hypothetical protein